MTQAILLCRTVRKLLTVAASLFLCVRYIHAFSSAAGDFNKPAEVRTEQSQLVFPGGGIFFYWQAGVVCYLREQGYDLSKCSFSGASAGALTATLACAEVDFYDATNLALKMAKSAGVWDRTFGLQGVWGPLIEEWLYTLLPESTQCVEGRLMLLVTPVPSLGKKKVSTFEDKIDLIRCNMASVHLPWFLDGKLTSDFRGDAHIDGSFLSKWEDYVLPSSIGGDSPALFVDWKNDPMMASKGGVDIVEALSPDGIWGLLQRGKYYASKMEEDGHFEGLPRIQL